MPHDYTIFDMVLLVVGILTAACVVASGWDSNQITTVFVRSWKVIMVATGAVVLLVNQVVPSTSPAYPTFWMLLVIGCMVNIIISHSTAAPSVKPETTKVSTTPPPASTPPAAADRTSDRRSQTPSGATGNK